MKILLVGDYSGYHANLAAGLRALGHEVFLTASGDGFKKIKSDWVLYSESNDFKGKISRVFKPYWDMRHYSGFDVVQLINPLVLGARPVQRPLYDLLKRNNRSLFVVLCGDDPLTVAGMTSERAMRYSWIDELMKEESSRRAFEQWRDNGFMDVFKLIVAKFDGCIPAAFEYKIGYAGLPNLSSNATMPIEIKSDDFDVVPWDGEGKLVFFHGVSRALFKGSSYIIEALERLKVDYPDKVEVIIEGAMPLSRYKEVMSSVHVVMDQTNSYSYAMNAILGLSMGKIVMSGAEDECLDFLNTSSSECPVVNITPDSEQIYRACEYLVLNPGHSLRLMKMARLYVERIHDSKVVANIFLSIWKSHLTAAELS